VIHQYVAAVDQGTASSRCILFDHAARIVSLSQKEHHHIIPRPGWVETEELGRRCPRHHKPARDATVLWDRETGEPVHNAINWQDTRTDHLVHELGGEQGQDRFRDRCGLPLATYFSGPKICWLLDNLPGLRRRAESGDVLFGTIESWLIWKLTGRHVTDPTNASRTMLMNLATLEWDDLLLDAMGVPRAILPEICSSAEVYGEASGTLEGVPVAAALGDQSAALVGQTCFERGEAKCTYGTGSFLLFNTGDAPVPSAHGLLSTVAYKLGARPAAYAPRRIDCQHRRTRTVVS
jgi:glycerol kinase